MTITNFTPDQKWGFLNAEAQRTELPSIYGPIDEAARNLGYLLKRRELRGLFDPAGIIPIQDGLSLSQCRKLWTVYSMIASAYVFSIYDDQAHVLPASLAVPMFDLSKGLGFPPILNYDAYVYNNFLELPGGLDPIRPESYEPLYTFSSPDDPEHEGEKWFIVDHVAAERAIGPTVAQIGNVQQLLGQGGASADVIAALDEATAGLVHMEAIIARMQERLDPAVYHVTTRRYVFPFEGVVFSGVPGLNDQPQHLRGETGGQSPVPRVFGAVLGLEHKSVDMAELGHHMLREHQRFVEQLASRRSLKSYLTERPELVAPYNALLTALAAFRTRHMRMAAGYLTVHGHTGGTGGSTFETYLRANRNITKDAVVV